MSHTFTFSKLVISPFGERGIQFDVDLTMITNNGASSRRWSSVRKNSSSDIYPLLRTALGKSQEEQECIFAEFFLQEQAAGISKNDQDEAA